MNYDGWVVVGTKLDTKQLEVDLKSAEKKLMQYEKEAERLEQSKVKAEADLQAYEEQKRLIKEVTDESNMYAQTEVEVTNNLRNEQVLLEELNAKYAKQINNLDSINEKIKQNSLNQQLVKNEINGVNEKLKNNEGIKSFHTSMEKASKGVEKLNNTMSKGIKRILRFSVALIGVESLFTVLSKAFNSNEEAVKKMENIWKGLGAVLQPVVDWITDKLMYGVAVVNEFIKALTGIDFVARANAKALDKQANAQKNLNKQTFSFDEMNIAQSNNSSSSSDSSDLIELPELSEETISKIHSVANSVKEIWDSTQGIRDILKKIIDFALKHPGVVLTILGGAKLAGWISSIIGVVGGKAGLFGIVTALTIIAGISIANVVDEIKNFHKAADSADKQVELLQQRWEEMKDGVDELNDADQRFIKTIQATITEINNASISASEHFENLGWLSLRTDIATGSFKRFKNQLEENLKTQETEMEYMDALYEKTGKTEEQTSSYIEYLKKYRDSLIEVNDNISKNKEVSGMLGDVIESNKDKISDLDEKINYLSGTLQTNADNMGNLADKTDSSKNKVNDLFNAINNLKDKAIKVSVNGDTSGLKSALNGIFDNPLLAPIKNVFENITGMKFPKLAVGGIVNNPGRGVPMGSYIAGEAGREGILPLTDSNTMAQLGQEIGKWITVQNVSNTYLNGRLIQRQIDQASKDKNFETNGW